MKLAADSQQTQQNDGSAPAELLPCHCGETPKCLQLEDEGLKYARAAGDCCSEWIIEFRCDYKTGTDAMKLAAEAWNDSPRAKQ